MRQEMRHEIEFKETIMIQDHIEDKRMYLSSYDDKKCILEDGYNKLQYFHKSPR